MTNKEQELERLVAQARATIISRGEKPTVKRLQVETKRKTEDVRRVNRKLTDRDAAELEAQLSLAFNPKIAIAFFEDREEQVQARTNIFKEKIENLENDCDALDEEITNLRAEREDLETRLTTEIDSYTESIDNLKQEKSHLEGCLQTMKDQIAALHTDLANEKKQRGDTEAMVAGISEELGKRSAELEAEQGRAIALHTQLTDAGTKLITATAKLDATERLTEALKHHSNELTTNLENSQQKYAEECEKRIKAEIALAVLNDQMKRLLETKGSRTPRGKRKEGDDC
jgi:chromosome segregation ATPase